MSSSVNILNPDIIKIIADLFVASLTRPTSAPISQPTSKQEWELALHKAINQCNYANVEYYFNKFNYTPSTDLMATAMHTHNVRMINLIIRYTNPKHKYLYHIQKWGIGTKNVVVSLLSAVLMIVMSVCVLIILMLKRV